jgi:hypothetical protein
MNNEQDTQSRQRRCMRLIAAWYRPHHFDSLGLITGPTQKPFDRIAVLSVRMMQGERDRLVY